MGVFNSLNTPKQWLLLTGIRFPCAVLKCHLQSIIVIFNRVDQMSLHLVHAAKE